MGLFRSRRFINRQFGISSSPNAVLLSFTVQPDGGITGTNFTQQPTVRALNNAGGTDTAFRGDVTIAIIYGNGSLSGTTTVTAVAGVATFTDLKITGTGHNILRATASGLVAARSGNVTIMPTATTVPVAPTALRYGANTTDLTNCGSGSTIDNLGAGDMTVLVRLKRNTAGNNQYVVSKYNAGATGWALSLSDGIAVGDIVLNFGRSSVDALVVSANSSRIAVGTWYDIGFTWQDADVTRELRLFQAAVGTAIAEVSGYDATSDQGSGTADADAAASLYIGNLQVAPTNPVLGDIEWVAVFSKKLTAQEMINCQIGFDRKSAAQITGIGGCVMLQQCNSTGTLTDLSGNANNGTTTGATTTNGISSQFAPSVFGLSDDVVNNTTYYYTSSQAEISYTTVATGVQISAFRNLDPTYDAQAAITVLEDNVYKGQILMPATGYGYGSLALTAGSKTVTLRNEVRSNPSVGNNEGTFLTSVLFSSGASGIIPATSDPLKTIVVMCDSILDGFIASPVGQFGALDSLRTYLRPSGYQVYVEGGGGWQAYDYMSTPALRSSSIDLIGKYNPSKLLIELGTNDKGRGEWTSTQFQSGYSDFLSGLHTGIPDLSIYAVTLPKNGGSDVGYEVWSYAITNAATGKNYVTLVSGDPRLWNGSNPGVDGVHPSNVASTGYILSGLKSILGV